MARGADITIPSSMERLVYVIKGWLYKQQRMQPLYPINTYAILDSNNEFTTEAATHLLPLLDGYMKQSMTSEKLNKYKYILRCYFKVMPSENCFFMYQKPMHEVIYDTLAQQLIFLDAIPSNNIIGLTHVQLSAVALHALRLTHFSKDVVQGLVMFGELGVAHVEKAVRHGFRPQRGFYPDVPSNDDIHDFTNFTEMSAISHDDYHTDLMSRQGFKFRNICLRFVDVIRRDLLSQVKNLAKKKTINRELYSASVWTLIDADFAYFNIPSNLAVKDNWTTGALISDVFDYSYKLGTDRSPFFINNKINDEGIVCFIDMILNPADWQTLALDPEDLIGRHKKYYDYAKYLQGYFKKDDPIFNIVIYRIYLKLKEIFPKQNIMVDVFLDKIAHANHDHLKIRLRCKRNNEIKLLGVVDNLNESQPLSDVMPSLLLSYVGINAKQHDSIKKMSSGFVMLVTILYLLQQPEFKRFRYLREDVAQILSFQLQMHVTNAWPMSAVQLEKAHHNLEKFIDFHTNRDKISKNSLRQLEAILNIFTLYQPQVKRIEAPIKEINTPFKKGFLN